MDVGAGWVRVVGKGDKERRVPLDPDVAGLIQAYLLVERPATDSDALFVVAKGPNRGRALTPADLDAVVAVAEPWQAEVVVPLRALRRRLKGGFPPLPPERVEAYRKGFSDLEIEGEHIAQEAMERAMDSLPKAAPARSDAALAAANLRAYFGHQQKEIGTVESKALTTILQACFPESPGSEISAALSA